VFGKAVSRKGKKKMTSSIRLSFLPSDDLEGRVFAQASSAICLATPPLFLERHGITLAG
jgi:hypothetical protein